MSAELRNPGPAGDLFGRKGRAWLGELELPIEERGTLDSGLRQIDFLDTEIALVDRAIAHDALNWPDARRLMTVPGEVPTSCAASQATAGSS